MHIAVYTYIRTLCTLLLLRFEVFLNHALHLEMIPRFMPCIVYILFLRNIILAHECRFGKLNMKNLWGKWVLLQCGVGPR